MHTLFAQYMLCPTQLNSSASSGWVYFSNVSHNLTNNYHIIFFVCWALAKRHFSHVSSQWQNWLWVDVDECTIVSHLRMRISQMMRYWMKIPRRWGWAFFNKSDRKKTPKNMDHLMIIMFNNLLGCFYCDELRFKSEFLELNCCSSHTGYFLKIWRLFGGGDGGFFSAWWMHMGACCFFPAKTRTPQLQYTLED